MMASRGMAPFASVFHVHDGLNALLWLGGAHESGTGPPVDWIETNMTPGGGVSFSVTPVASVGPWLLMPIV